MLALLLLCFLPRTTLASGVRPLASAERSDTAGWCAQRVGLSAADVDLLGYASVVGEPLAMHFTPRHWLLHGVAASTPLCCNVSGSKHSRGQAFGARPHSPHMRHAAVHAPHALCVTRAAPARASHPVRRGMRYLWPATCSLARHDGRSRFFGRGFASDRAGDDVCWDTNLVAPVGIFSGSNHSRGRAPGTHPHSPHMGHAAVHAPHALRVTGAAPACMSHPVGRGMRYLWPAPCSLARHDGHSCFFGRGFANDKAGDDLGWGTIFVAPVGALFLIFFARQRAATLLSGDRVLRAAAHWATRCVLGLLLASFVPVGGGAPSEETTVMLRALTSEENAYEWIPVEPLASDVVLLVLVATLAQPLIYIGARGRHAIGKRTGTVERRSTAVSVARGIYLSLSGHAPEADLILAGESREGGRVVIAPIAALPPAELIARTNAQRLRLVAKGVSFAWLTYTALACTPALDVATTAVQTTLSFVGPTPQLRTFDFHEGVGTARFTFGRMEMRGLVQRPLPLERGADQVRLRLNICRQAERLIRRTLDIPGRGLVAQCMRDWSDRVEPAPTQQIPAGLLGSLPSFHFDWLADKAFAAPLPAVRAPYQLPSEPQICPVVPPGTTLQDMLMPVCRDNLTRCEQEYLRDLLDIDKGPMHPRRRPDICALAPECLWPVLRGCVWDFRDPKQPKPLEYGQPPRTHLNVEFYKREMADHPDQELLSHMVHGIRYQAFTQPLDRQFVLIPHLLSIGKAFDAVQRELRRLSKPDRGKIELYNRTPFFPIRCSAQGTTPRKYEPGRDRRTSDCSAPHNECFDSEKRPVWSLNAQSMRPRVVDGVEHPVPKEHKPTLRSLMRDLSVLLHLGWLSQDLVFLFADDFADYFNQLDLAEEELWKSVTLTLAMPGDPGYDPSRPSLIYASERSLGFGSTRSSNYAQRHSNLLVEVASRRALTGDRQIRMRSRNAHVHRWMERRRALSKRTGRVEDRGFTMWCYTDDQIAGVVGAEATLHLLQVWTELVNEAGLWMAIPKKRQVGTWAVWLGVLIFSVMGVAVVTLDKLLRATELVEATLNLGIVFADYMRLCGQLEHIRCINGQPRLALAGMYEPHRSALHANDRVRVNPMMERCLLEWRIALLRTGGAGFLIVFNVEWAGHTASLLICTSSDAAMAGTPNPGLGGYCNGTYWRYDLRPFHLWLFAISALELMAALVNIMILWPTLRGFDAILHECDALATPQVLTRDSARSPTLQIGIVLAQDHATFVEAATSGRYGMSQIYGDRNVPSDLVSRKYMVQFFALMRALRLRPRELHLDESHHAFIETWTARELDRRDTAQGLTPDERAQRQHSFLRRTALLREARGQCNSPSEHEQEATRIEQQLMRKAKRTRHGKTAPPRGMARQALLATTLLLCCGDVEPHPGPLADLLAQDPREMARFRAQAEQPGLSSGAHTSVAHLQTVAQLSAPSRNASAYAEATTRVVGEEAIASGEAMLRELLRDDSEFALRPTDLDEFRSRVIHVAQLQHIGMRPGTRKSDKNGWKHHVAFCTEHNTPVERPQRAFDENPMREAYREAATMLLAAQTIKPRSKKDAEAKPSSSLNIILAIRRRMSYGGIICPAFKLTRQVLKGMCEAFMFVHGKDSLKPRRKEAMPDWVRDAMFAIPPGTRLPSHTFQPGSHVTDTVLDAISVLEDTGLRKAEIVRQRGDLYIRCLTWADVAWRDGDDILTNLTNARLSARLVYLSLLITPTNSKCDATNEHWGNKPIPIPYADTVHNAVVRIAARWIRLGIGQLTLEERRHIPLFANAEGYAYEAEQFDRFHTAMLRFVCPALAAVLSWHSYRIRLAARLRKAGAKDGRIQAYVRWQNPESLHIYARWDLDEYEKWIKRSRRQTLVAREAVNIPVIDPSAALHGFQGLLQRLQAPRHARRYDKNPELTVRAPRFRAAVGAQRARLRGGGDRGDANAVDLQLPCAYDRCAPDLLPRGDIPEGFVARRQHARSKCYWVFDHAELGRFDSLKQASARLAAHDPTESAVAPLSGEVALDSDMEALSGVAALKEAIAQCAASCRRKRLTLAQCMSDGAQTYVAPGPDRQLGSTATLLSCLSSVLAPHRTAPVAAVASLAMRGMAKRRRKNSTFALMARTKPHNLTLRLLSKNSSVRRAPYGPTHTCVASPLCVQVFASRRRHDARLAEANAAAVELPPPPTSADAEEWVCLTCGAANTDEFCTAIAAGTTYVCGSLRSKFGYATTSRLRSGTPSGSLG